MEGYDASTYGERFAAAYDDWTVRTGIASGTAAAVAELTDILDELDAPQGPVLELGVGTGRVALPLVDRGIDVSGVDASPAMVAQLRAKPGGDAVDVRVADFADLPGEGTYPLIFVVFNTFFALADQEAQVRCFASVAEHLRPGGRFLLETFVPDLTRFDDEQTVRARQITVDRVELEVSLHDPVAQRVESQVVVLGELDTRLYPVAIRYAWPAELDLMARLAGLRMYGRWGGWGRTPFTASSRTQVVVYEKPKTIP